MSRRVPTDSQRNVEIGVGKWAPLAAPWGGLLSSCGFTLNGSVLFPVIYVEIDHRFFSRFLFLCLSCASKVVHSNWDTGRNNFRYRSISGGEIDVVEF